MSKYLWYNMSLKVNKCSHFNKESGPSSGIGRISENEAVCLLEIWSRPPGIYVRPSSVFFPQGCITLTPSPMFLPESSEWWSPWWKLGEKLVWIWGTAVSGFRGANPGMRVHPRVEISTLISTTMEEPTREMEERTEGRGGAVYRTRAGSSTPTPEWVTFPFCHCRKLNLSVASS